jgi:dTDP-4-dehydrorhamnose reductase
MKVGILGCSGMLGSMLLDFFPKQNGLEIVGVARESQTFTEIKQRIRGVRWEPLDAGACNVEQIQSALGGASWAINAIGIIKPRIHDDVAAEVERAVVVNSLFPHQLARAAENANCRVIQIATDCVYSGVRGRYVEEDEHDPLDVYGKTKSLGEVRSPKVSHLRCSIIGPEPKGHMSLLDWFLSQPKGAVVNGFRNHLWNGISTLQFAKICYGIIRSGMTLPHVQHIVPEARVTKYELLLHFRDAFRRPDIVVNEADAELAIDRTLSTSNGQLHQAIWRNAGYDKPPTVHDLVEELASYDSQMGWSTMSPGQQN